jgi:hypothetical protein
MSSTLTGGLNSIASSLNGLAANLGKGVGGLLDSTKGIAGSAFAAITKSFPTLKVGVPQNMKQIATDAVKSAQNSGTELAAGAAAATSALNNAGAGAASLASGAASSLTNAASGAVNTAVTAATGAVAGAAAGAIATATNAVTSILPNSISTGLGALPGAQKAVSTVVNNATGALNSIPGVAQISSAVSQITASITSGGALGTAATDLINKMKNPGASLQALASLGLPAGAAAALNSAIGSLSSGGAVPIKLPTVGLNTIDRAGLTAQLGSVFGSTKIPVPNFTGNPATTGETAGTKAVNRVADIEMKVKEVQKEIDAMIAVIRGLKKGYSVDLAVYNEHLVSLPAGDPQLESELAALRATKTKVNAMIDDVEVLRTKRDKLIDSIRA